MLMPTKISYVQSDSTHAGRSASATITQSKLLIFCSFTCGTQYGDIISNGHMVRGPSRTRDPQSSNTCLPNLSKSKIFPCQRQTLLKAKKKGKEDFNSTRSHVITSRVTQTGPRFHQTKSRTDRSMLHVLLKVYLPSTSHFKNRS